jgi:hypothetical protein
MSSHTNPAPPPSTWIPGGLTGDDVRKIPPPHAEQPPGPPPPPTTPSEPPVATTSSDPPAESPPSTWTPGGLTHDDVRKIPPPQAEQPPGPPPPPVAELPPPQAEQPTPTSAPEPKSFSVTLTGSQEVPPNASAASGTGIVVWDTATDTATYAFTVKGLDFGPRLGLPPQTATTVDDVTAMHFHFGGRGMAGPVVFGQLGPAQDTDDLGVVLNADGSWTILGAWETTDRANAPISDFAALLDSTPVGSDAPLYWNVHTAVFPQGEIRGQLVAASDLNIMG